MMVSLCPYGLGNKIRSLMSCIALDADPRACWLVGGRGNRIRFAELFTNPYEIARRAVPRHARVHESHFLEVAEGEPDPKAAWDRLNGSGLRNPAAWEGAAASLLALYLRAAQSLTPAPAIRQMSEDLRARLPPAFTAVHVRTWTASPCSASRRRRDSFRKRGGLHLYFDAVDRLPSDAALFVASDSADALAALAARYGQRVVVSPAVRWIGSGKGLEHAWALAEIVTIAGAARIVRSGESTFAEVAWWMGGGRAEQITVQDHEGPASDPVRINLRTLGGDVRRLVGRLRRSE